MTESKRYRLGFDIGGTFTDFVLFDVADGAISLHKRLTTPHDASIAAIEGIRAITAERGIAVNDLDEIIHGTTLVTNAIIERKGARVGFLTTAGFRDLLQLGTEQRYDIYDLFLKFPEPLVSRPMRLEVAERIDASGAVVTPLDEAQVLVQARALVDMGAEAVAIGFLHAYRNPAHERRARDLIVKAFPQLTVSISSDVFAEIREYQRFVTTCANAYVQPLMANYLDELGARLLDEGFSGPLRLIHSAGGLVPVETAKRFPIRLLESGPAGGALAASFFGAGAGLTDLIAFDMGGTTAKGTLIREGRPEIAQSLEAGRVHRFIKGSGLPIRSPVVDMIEIGGGGGSIAAIDEVGLLRVGPDSAGSAPGPACYDLGGTAPTVTDANLTLGYYDPGYFLGGKMALRADLARRSLEGLGAALGLSVEEVAAGVHKLVSENMAAAVREHAVEKGVDPRALSMVAFGGAGPTHAASVARILGIGEVVVPPASGAASALGFLAAPLSFEVARSYPIVLGPDWDAGALEQTLVALEAEASAHLIEAGIAQEAIIVERRADMRLLGQMHEIEVALPARIEPGMDGVIAAAFTARYRAQYASMPDGARIELLSLRVFCRGPAPTLTVRGTVDGAPGGDAIKGTRRIWVDGSWQTATVYDRYALAVGTEIVGPAIVEERESTTVLHAGDKLTVDAALNLRMAMAGARTMRLRHADSFEAAVAAIEADPIGLEIMWSRLAAISEEMWLTVCRTAYSLIVSEAQDFACELLDAQGETLAHSRRGMPVFNLTLPRAVRALLDVFPPDTLRPGDVLITNDPWTCAGHLPDIAIVTPVFVEDRLVALMGTVGHVSDIGGTKDSLTAREVYDEGFQIPPMKLMAAGEINTTLVELIRKNVRGGDQVVGDLLSFVGANDVGAQRLRTFMDEYGLDELRPLAHVVQSRSEKAMRAAIAALPDGTVGAHSWANPLGTPYKLPLKLTIEGDTIALDFDGAPPQLPRGGLNCTLSYTEAHATYPLKCILTPNVRGNAGCYRAFSVSAPAGSILNAQYPASVNIRTRTGWYIGPSVYRALAPLLPEQVQAFTGLPMSLTVYGQAGETFYSDVFLCGGGQGGSAAGDGLSGIIFPSSAANSSVEMFEARVPILVGEKALLPDTGGAGAYRGGLSQRILLRKHHRFAQPVYISVFPESVGLPVEGLFGGAPGEGASGRVVRRDGSVIRDCGTGELIELADDDVWLEAILTGGSGYGPAADRRRDAIARDIAEGFVTERGARHDYGYTTAVVAGE